MDIVLARETMAALAEHAGIPIAFQVDSILVVSIQDSGLGGFSFSERKLDKPYVKDYDAIAGEGPKHWTERFDVSKWGFVSAHIGGRRVGGAVIAFDTPGIDMLEGRNDLAVLWDIRVVPEGRRRGVGSALFIGAERWATERGCCQLKVETQNINVAACRFYARQGCELGAINRFVYRDLPGETQLLWYKHLNPATTT